MKDRMEKMSMDAQAPTGRAQVGIAPCNALRPSWTALPALSTPILGFGRIQSEERSEHRGARQAIRDAFFVVDRYSLLRWSRGGRPAFVGPMGEVPEKPTVGDAPPPVGQSTHLGAGHEDRRSTSPENSFHVPPPIFSN